MPIVITHRNDRKQTVEFFNPETAIAFAKQESIDQSYPVDIYDNYIDYEVKMPSLNVSYDRKSDKFLVSRYYYKTTMEEVSEASAIAWLPLK